ncbi:hypothetical protein [Dehalogenimonas sp. 4OHTPN]|uniref:Fibronectin type-III domain-containing protein n=1 Tax=Dehalogenimonas sp. 4OHTPN TaxID=3166643 RepID=A0AAU8GBX6_9CHLR
MKKLNKIFSILLTAAIMTSMLVTGAIPVGAADNAWGEFAVPKATSEVMPNDLTGTGLLTMAIDGTLYAYVTDGTAKLAKSVDGGKKWTTVAAPVNAPIAAIFCSPSEANVLYIAQGNTVYKSTDSGATFATRGTVPAGEVVTSVAAALAAGSYKIMIGTADDPAVVGDVPGNTYYQNEGDFFLSFTAFGQFQAVAANFDVMAIKLSPNFATDQGIVVLASDGTNVEAHFSTAGGVFGASLKKAVIPVAAATTVAIAFPAEFAMPASTIFYAGVGDGAGASPNSGVYRVVAAAASSASLSTITMLGGNFDIVSLSASGSYAGTGTVFAGTADGKVRRSSDSGGTFANQSKGLGNTTGAVFVVMAGDYATSGKVYALQAAGAADDESGFFVSTNQGSRFNAISLLNSTIATINDAAFAANGDVYMVTAATGGVLSLWRYMGGWERVQSGFAAGTMMDIEISPNYATDKAVFFIDGANKINVSSNNGETFAAQSSASTVTIVDYEVIDLMTFVVAGATGMQRTTNNGFIWNTVSTANILALARSSDGTALAGLTSAGAITRSTDLGATWSTATTSVLAGANKFTFQNGSTNVLWATTGGGGLYSIDLAATTVAWSANKVVSGTAFDSAGHMTIGMGIASGAAPAGQSVTYGICTDIMARKISTGSLSGFIAFSGFTGASALYIQPAAGANKLWVIADGNKLFSLTDQLAVAVSGVAVGSFTTSKAVINWAAVAGADRYAVAFQQGSTALTDPYTATMASSTVSGTTYTIGADPGAVGALASNTTYTVSVWAVRAPTGTDTNAPRVSFAGSVTFSTQPAVPPPPVGLAPAPAATGIPTMPSFQWGAIAGATSYELELSTSPTFSPLTGTKITATVPAAAWTGTALANNTVYYWRVRAITATGTSDWVVSTFTTVAATPTTPPVTIPTSPVVTPTVTVVIPDTETPTYIWAIIGVGALLTILVVVLIVRTRRVV